MQQTEPASYDTANKEAITVAMKKFARAVETFDADTMVSLWDPDADTIVYQPEELSYALHSHAELHAYITNLPNVILGLRDTRVVEFTLDVDDDVAHAYVRFWCRIERPDDEPMDGQIRQTHILRRRPGGWYYTHYHESRQVPGFRTSIPANGA